MHTERLLAVACLPLGTLLAAFLLNAEFAASYDATVGAALREGLSYINRLFPFSVTELFLLLLIPFLSVFLFCGIRARDPSRTVILPCLLLFWVFFLYVTVFAAGRYKPPLATVIGVTVGEPTEEELLGCAFWLSELAATPARVPEEAEIEADLRAGLCAAGERYGLRTNRAASGKKTKTPLLARLGYFGLYAFPFCEVTVSDRIPRATYTFTLAHELAHASGLVREEEADVFAFLACLESQDAYLVYAGASGMLGRLLSELYKCMPGVWEGASGSLSEEVRDDLLKSGEAYEGGMVPTVAADTPTYSETVRLLCALYRTLGGGTQ